MPNPVISAITLPSGTTYDIKDATARAAIENLQNTENVLSTDAASTPYGVTWDSGGTTITGTLVASAATTKKIYLVPITDPDTKNNFKEYLTVKTDATTYAWEMIGTTAADLSGLGALAYQDSASATYTPQGSVSQPSFTGSSTTSTGTFTPAGSVSLTNSNQTAAVSPAESGDATYTPAGNVSAPTISISSAGATTTVNSITAVGTLPSLTTTVSSETLTISFSQGTLPTKGDDVTVKTGDAAYTATAPAFTGTGVRLVTGNISVPSSASFSGTEGNISVTGTPSGTVSQPTFSGTAATITVT